MAKLVAAESARHTGIYGPRDLRRVRHLQRVLRADVRATCTKIQFSPTSNGMSGNMIMQFQGLPKSWS
jgi:acyl-CoA dehydrogenase